MYNVHLFCTFIVHLYCFVCQCVFPWFTSHNSLNEGYFWSQCLWGVTRQGPLSKRIVFFFLGRHKTLDRRERPVYGKHKFWRDHTLYPFSLQSTISAASLWAFFSTCLHLLENSSVELCQFGNDVNANGGAWIRVFDPEISNSLWFSPEPGPASAHILWGT